MRSPVSSIIRKATRRVDEPLNIISFSTHESYQTNLAKTGHNFYLMNGPGLKKWNTAFRPVPLGTTLLRDGELPPHIDFDLVLSQNKVSQFDMAKSVSKSLNIPLVSLEHCTCSEDYTATAMNHYQTRRGDIDVFISNYSRDMWGWDEENSVVIQHGIDTELFKPRAEYYRSRHVLSVVNDWHNRDVECGYSLWKEIVDTDPKIPTVVLGDNPGLSEPARNPEHLALVYATSLVFLNTSLVSPLPMSLLESLASGCGVVSTNNCGIPDVLEHGVHALTSNIPETLKIFTNKLLNEPLLAEELGRNARHLIMTKFSMEDFVNNWNMVFQTVVGK